MIRRAVPVSWDEAVAVIEELCSLLTADGEERSVPGFEDVAIAANGTVSVSHRRWRGGAGPVDAGRALHALLSTADVPMALRLFVTQAKAPETHGSLREFASALAYFGKPGRPVLISALYRRATAAGGIPPSVPTPRPQEEHIPKRDGERRPTSRRGTWGVKIGLAACLLVAAAWIWSSGMLTDDSVSKSSILLSQAKQAITELGAGVRALTSAEPPAAGPDQAPPVVLRTQTPRETRASNRPDIANLAQAVTPDTLLPPAPAAVHEEDASATIPAPPVQAPAPPIEPAVQPDAGPRLYSTEDTDVSPPVLLYPQLPPPLMIAQPGATRVNRMELVVSADGTVERVRLVNGPTRMPDMMLLSGAKMWRFTPAVKEGAPVRYRAIVTWTGFP